MVSEFYRRHSAALLIFLLAALPILTICGELLQSNNDIETWLPRDSESRRKYDEFCANFGADETILIAFEKPFPSPNRLAAASARLQGLEGVGNCWTRQQVMDSMQSNSVTAARARSRLVNLMSTPGDDLETMLVTINSHGIAHRRQTVAEIKGQLSYCQFDHAVLAGGPIVADQLDRLGSRRAATTLFTLTLLICLVLLKVNIGCWKTSGGLMLSNILCIELTLATIWMLGMEMNFIMSSLPVMVMVFTTAASVHFIGHYRHGFGNRNAAGTALAAVIRPSAFAALTTIIGLVSLAISDIGPIPAFGLAAAIGTFFSFVVGVLVTPAVLIALKYCPPEKDLSQDKLRGLAMMVVNRPWRVMAAGLMCTLICALGLFELRSLISPLDFLPNDDPVLRDAVLVQKVLTSPTSIEAVIDFGGENTSFVERLREVRKTESQLLAVNNICHVLSLADFFPEELTENSMSLSRLAAASAGDGSVGGLMVDGSRLWRCSLRLKDDEPEMIRQTMRQLETKFAGRPISFTGLGPLLEEAQRQIFEGFWKSFASAFVLITIVMMIALRSISAGLVAMIPNLTPILLIFGILGWADYPIDIGIMMTASIALGLAVDGTFHFLFTYRDCSTETNCRYRAVRKALLQTGMPIICSAVISGCGLLALGFSPFKPTMRFGVLMFALLMAALIGDLLLLPAFLACGAKRKRLTLKPAPVVAPTGRIAA